MTGLSRDAVLAVLEAMLVACAVGITTTAVRMGLSFLFPYRTRKYRGFPAHLRDAVPHEAGSVDGLPKMGHVHDMEAVAAAIDAMRNSQSLTTVPSSTPKGCPKCLEGDRIARLHQDGRTHEEAILDVLRRSAQQQNVAEWELARDRAASQGPRHSGDLEVRVFVRAGMEWGCPEMTMEIQRETLGWWRR